MAVKIQKVTVVGSDRSVEVGQEVNGRKVDHIKNWSNEYEGHIHNEYSAYDENGEPIVEFVNVPVIIDFVEDENNLRQRPITT